MGQSEPVCKALRTWPGRQGPLGPRGFRFRGAGAPHSAGQRKRGRKTLDPSGYCRFSGVSNLPVMLLPTTRQPSSSTLVLSEHAKSRVPQALTWLTAQRSPLLSAPSPAPSRCAGPWSPTTFLLICLGTAPHSRSPCHPQTAQTAGVRGHAGQETHRAPDSHCVTAGVHRYHFGLVAGAVNAEALLLILEQDDLKIRQQSGHRGRGQTAGCWGRGPCDPALCFLPRQPLGTVTAPSHSHNNYRLLSSSPRAPTSWETS